MGRVHIISASAGSGKTTRLANLLHDEVASGAIRPEAILATTFTNKAAAELEERVRTRLLSAGRTEEALRLRGARLGTVNAVCGRLVSEFAFTLGLSPELEIVDEALAERTLLRCLSAVVTPTEAAALAELQFHMPSFDWEDAVRRVTDQARLNGLGASELRASAERSRAAFVTLLGPTQSDGRRLDRELTEALAGFVHGVNVEVDKTKTTAEALKRAGGLLEKLEAGRAIPWKEWVWLSALKPAKASEALAIPVRAAAAKHDVHPALRGQVLEAITLVFDIASRALEAYAAEKRVWGVIDFVDQEVLTLQLLKREDVREELRRTIDLVLVDEFQDTSPLQLAVFLELAELAQRSVWVGDQKQAIFGFRGTDPSLMDAAITALLGTEEPETLKNSWRSRPELVALTSDLFAPAFAAQGIPEARVRLVPGDASEPGGLGDVAEVWQMMSKNKEQDAHALATGVHELISSGVQVRDRQSGASRPVRPGDIAVLCKKNDECLDFAAALEAIGLRAVLARSGLLETAEAQTVLAGLRLFVDGQDSLAIAALARRLVFPEEPNAWLEAVSSEPYAKGLSTMPHVLAIHEARERQPTAGAIAAMEAVMEALSLRDLCLSWGDAQARLANLDRLRAHAFDYVSACLAEGRGATAAGLIAHLEELAASGKDVQAALESEDAVVVSTWHRAKGLEWPVTVLASLDTQRDGSALGVSVVSDVKAFDVRAPLKDRWIRFWPTPYDARQNSAPFHTRLDQHEATRFAMDRELRQELRLLYVGWTRARDRVVLATRKGVSAAAQLSLLGEEVFEDPENGEATWGTRTLGVTVRDVAPSLPVERAREPGFGAPARPIGVHPPAQLFPSAAEGRGAAGAVAILGPRAPISGRPDMAALGSAVHGFLAADQEGRGDAERLATAARLLERWEVPGALQPEAVVAMGDALRAWVSTNHPSAKWRRELPVMLRHADGSVLKGTADLVLELPDALIVIDHKTFPGSIEDGVTRAEAHAGQLSAYVQALEAALGKRVSQTFIHLPISGVMIPVDVELGKQPALATA